MPTTLLKAANCYNSADPNSALVCGPWPFAPAFDELGLSGLLNTYDPGNAINNKYLNQAWVAMGFNALVARDQLNPPATLQLFAEAQRGGTIAATLQFRSLVIQDYEWVAREDVPDLSFVGSAWWNIANPGNGPHGLVLPYVFAGNINIYYNSNLWVPL